MTYNSLVSNEENQLLDAVEVSLLNMEGTVPIDFPLKHSFVPGFYVRQIFMPKGSKLTSQIHKSRHPYYISQGRLIIWNKGEAVEITAPYTGITEPGTRRYLKILEDTIFTTFHSFPQITGEENNYTDAEKMEIVSEIEKLLAEQRINPLVGMSYKELKSEQKSLSHA
jgi:quercetin dioxygenase-like cupin family protein